MRIAGRLGILSSLFGGLLLAAAAAKAESVYRCRDASGSIAYQDGPCADAQRQIRVELIPAPPAAPSPDYGVAHPTPPTRASRASRRGRPGAEPSSYECRAANGEVFYRHSACPRSIPASDPGGRRRSGEASSAAVTATPLTRREACRRLAAAGSIGRSGRDRDERVTTYERNAGRDPCR